MPLVEKASAKGNQTRRGDMYIENRTERKKSSGGAPCIYSTLATREWSLLMPLLEQVLRFIICLILLQESNLFFLEGVHPMVLLLVLDIGDDVRQLGVPQSKSAKALLPFKNSPRPAFLPKEAG